MAEKEKKEKEKEKEKKGPKVVTVIIKVDLGCRCCAEKIKSTLCKLQKRFKISSIVFDEEKDTVTVSGPFDPNAFIKKLCCMAYKVIKDVSIKPDPPPKPPKPTPTPPPPTPPPPCPPLWPPLCLPPCLHPCQPPCPYPCPPVWPPLCPPTKPTHRPVPTPICSGTCNEPKNDCCSCNTPRPPPTCNSGYPCYQIVCESEPSPVCSIM